MVVGNSGSVERRRALQPGLEHLAVVGTSGVRLSFRPFPMVCTLAPVESVMSAQVRPASSEIRSPAWMASANIAWSRRPVQWSVAGSEQRVDLGLGEVGDEVALGPLVRDREYPLDRRGVLGVVERHVCEQRVDRREAVVAAADAVAAIFLEVVQERGDQRRVELGDVQLAGRLCRSAWRRTAAAAGSLAVGGDRVRARAALAISRSVK